MSKSNQAAKSNQTTAKPNGMVAVLAPIATATTAVPAAPIKRPAIAYTKGQAAGAPPNAPAVTLGGVAYNGTLPATNPANRGVVGNVTAKLPGALVVGNGKGPRSAHGALMFQAVCAVLPCTPAQAAQAAGSGGAAFVAYAVKHGWLAAK